MGERYIDEPIVGWKKNLSWRNTTLRSNERDRWMFGLDRIRFTETRIFIRTVYLFKKKNIYIYRTTNKGWKSVSSLYAARLIWCRSWTLWKIAFLLHCVLTNSSIIRSLFYFYLFIFFVIHPLRIATASRGKDEYQCRFLRTRNNAHAHNIRIQRGTNNKTISVH